METVVIIKKHQTDTWNAGPPMFAAVATDIEAARRWITEETKKNEYAQGQTVDFWLGYGTFSLHEVEVFS